jgi:hypothetical protein
MLTHCYTICAFFLPLCNTTRSPVFYLCCWNKRCSIILQSDKKLTSYKVNLEGFNLIDDCVDQAAYLKYFGLGCNWFVSRTVLDISLLFSDFVLEGGTLVRLQLSFPEFCHGTSQYVTAQDITWHSAWHYMTHYVTVRDTVGDSTWYNAWHIVIVRDSTWQCGTQYGHNAFQYDTVRDNAWQYVTARDSVWHSTWHSAWQHVTASDSTWHSTGHIACQYVTQCVTLSDSTWQ